MTWQGEIAASYLVVVKCIYSMQSEHWCNYGSSLSNEKHFITKRFSLAIGVYIFSILISRIQNKYVVYHGVRDVGVIKVPNSIIHMFVLTHLVKK